MDYTMDNLNLETKIFTLFLLIDISILLLYPMFNDRFYMISQYRNKDNSIVGRKEFQFFSYDTSLNHQCNSCLKKKKSIYSISHALICFPNPMPHKKLQSLKKNRKIETKYHLRVVQSQDSVKFLLMCQCSLRFQNDVETFLCFSLIYPESA